MTKVMMIVLTVMLCSMAQASDFKNMIGDFEGIIPGSQSKCEIHSSIDSVGLVSISIVDDEGAINYPKISQVLLQRSLDEGFANQFDIIPNRETSFRAKDNWYMGGSLDSTTGQFFIRIQYELTAGNCFFMCTKKLINKTCAVVK